MCIHLVFDGCLSQQVCISLQNILIIRLFVLANIMLLTANVAVADWERLHNVYGGKNL